MSTRPKPHLGDPLNTSEARLLDEFCRFGESNKELAFHLHYSQDTVKHYLSNAMIKTGHTNRTALALWWCREGRRQHYQEE